MAESSDTPPSALDFAPQITVLTAQVQENANHFLALEEDNVTLHCENRNLLERHSAIETSTR